MTLSPDLAERVAKLLNEQNQLTTKYTAEKVLEARDRYILRLGENSELLGAVEVKKVQWYQCEIDHLTVSPGATRRGVGTWLLRQAEAKARELGARVAQCTVRVGNEASERLFKKFGYQATVTFSNERTKNRVTVYQKALATGPEGTA